MDTKPPVGANRTKTRRAPAVAAAAAMWLVACGAPSTPTDGGRTDAVATTSAAPAARIYHSLVSDGGGLYVFGGLERHGWDGALDDVWAYDVSEARWAGFGGSEPDELGHPAYDDESGRFIMLVGDGGTWAYDPSADVWEERHPTASPSPRCGERTVYDAQSDRVVLYGGFACTGTSDPGLDDTWNYDYNSDTWELMEPDRSPPGRMFHGMVYDAALDRTVMWGGRVDDVRVWVYDVDGDRWSSHRGRGGPARMRAYHAMSYDPTQERVLMFGGLELSHPQSLSGTLRDDLWAYDVGKSRWTEVVVDQGPDARALHQLTFDPGTGSHVMFGGELGFAYSNDVTDEIWTFDPANDAWSGPIEPTAAR